MKALIALWFALAATARADELSDRGAINAVIAALNDRSLANQQRVMLFTPNATINSDVRENASGPWSEVTWPKIVVDSVQFFSPRLAMINAVSHQVGSVIGLRNSTLTVVMPKDGELWRIACLQPVPLPKRI